MPEDVTFFGERPKVRYLWQVPQAASPEILLAGRSNAGKSTLLNAVLDAAGKKKSAGTSQKGGRTRTLNWYPVGFSMPLGWEGDGTRIIREEHESLSLEDELKAAGEGCCIVDCFGLGDVYYSDLKASRLQTWGPLLQNFLSERSALQTLCHLISSEQEGQLSEGDEQLVDIFARSAIARQTGRHPIPPVRYVVVLTKTDLFEPPAIAKFQERLRQALSDLGHEPSKIIACSSLDPAGIVDFQEVVSEATARGWKQLDEWSHEAWRAQRPPPGYDKNRRKQTRAAYTSTAKPAANRPSRGGRGASTIMPPRV